MILANVEIAGKFISTTHEVDYGADGADAMLGLGMYVCLAESALLLG